MLSPDPAARKSQSKAVVLKLLNAGLAFVVVLLATVLLVASSTCSAEPQAQEAQLGVLRAAAVLSDNDGGHDAPAPPNDGEVVAKKLSSQLDAEGFGAVETDGGRAIHPEEFGATFYTILSPREVDCYYQPAREGSILHVLFAVESEARIQYPDVDMEVHDPTGKLVVREEHSIGNVEGDHEKDHLDVEHDGTSIKARVAGDYKICFSNANSMTSGYWKKVYIDIGPVLNIKYKARRDDLSEGLTRKMEESLDFCTEVLDTAMEIQLKSRRWHKRDWRVIEQNESMVTFRSVIMIGVMALVFGLQTLFVRSFFNTPQSSKA